MPAAKPSAIFVRYEPGRISLSGLVNQDVVINAQKMLHQLMETASQRSVDLICIVAGTYAIDRVILRAPDVHNECGIRTLRIIFEVSDFAFWSQPSITELLTDILWNLTGDTYLVSFAQRAQLHQTAHPQKPLDFEKPHPTRIALYSGGLDSAAGLANRLISTGEAYMLLTVGHHPSIRSNCRKQVNLLRNILLPPTLHHASFLVRLNGGIAGKMKRQEATQRARGLLFYATAALLADACDVEEIEVFENGVGAINLPLSEGGLTDGLSTRGAHPGVLEKTARLFGLTLDRPMHLSLPFIHSTKAEMLVPLATRPYLADWLKQSQSCIHSSLRIARKRHCGHCAACIERRQAFRVAGIQDDAKDYEIDLFNGGMPKRFDYLLTYLENARSWTTYHPSVRSRLERHRVLSDMAHLAIEPIEDLLMRHAKESLETYGHFEIRDAA